MIYLSFKWKAWVGRRRKRKEGKERIGKENRGRKAGIRPNWLLYI
jgi:hypothetical protein